jgi:D-3-phosphoglycerate dehydrogenase
MKKRTPSKLVVKRISTSPYFKESFAQLEKETITHKTQSEVLGLNSPTLADVLITNTHTNVDTLTVADLERCQLMIHPNSGYDNLPASFVEKADFPIVIGNPIRAQAVTNFILSALFTHYSALPLEKNWNESRKWPRLLLSELTVLILGHGHIGRLLSESLKPLVKELRVYDPYQNLNELNLKNVDVLIPACSLNTKNKHIINRERLMQLNENFLLINAARGQLVKTDELLTVLRERPTANCYLDVFEKEPADFTAFAHINNLKLSSHIAGVYANIDRVTADYVAQVIFDFQNLDENLFQAKYADALLKNRLQKDFLI